MPAASRLALFIPAALALLLVPGPAVVYVVTRSMHQGRRAGLISVAGLHTATLLHIAGAAAGLSAILVRSALLFSVVKYAGAAYLVLLGVRTLLRGDHDAERAGGPRTGRRLYAEGFVVNALNPKTALFFLAFLPQFVDVARGNATGQIVVFGLTFLILGVITDSLYALAGARIAPTLRRSATFRRRERYATGGVFVGLGAAAGLSGSG